MRIVSFESESRSTYGVSAGDRVREATAGFREQYPDLRAVIAAGAETRLADNVQSEEHSFSAIRMLPVIPNAEKILCVGVNYRPHIEEMGRSVPDYPVVFIRFPDSLVGHGEAILRPSVSEQFDFEGELAVVIGRRARHVSQDTALEHVAGYCCFIDGSVRDWQRHTPQFTAGKNFYRSGAMGPCMTTADEIPDPAVLELTTRVNGTVMQEGHVRDLIFDIPRLIEYCSTFTELRPGDVIATGTPGGVGAARTPPVWLKQGDTVEVDIAGVGVLETPVRDESG